jgi:hypothetical protein
LKRFSVFLCALSLVFLAGPTWAVVTLDFDSATVGDLLTDDYFEDGFRMQCTAGHYDFIPEVRLRIDIVHDLGPVSTVTFDYYGVPFNLLNIFRIAADGNTIVTSSKGGLRLVDGLENVVFNFSGPDWTNITSFSIQTGGMAGFDDINVDPGCLVGPGGGTCSTPDGSVDITIPPGALDDDTSFLITETGTSYEISTNCGNGTALFGVDIQPEGVTFNQPITIVFSWPDADDDGRIDGTNIQEKNVRISKDNVCITGQCSAEPVDGVGAECDMDGNTFSIEVDSLSVFTLFSLSPTSGGVGGIASMADKTELLLPWMTLAALILLSAGIVIVRRLKKQS